MQLQNSLITLALWQYFLYSMSNNLPKQLFLVYKGRWEFKNPLRSINPRKCLIKFPWGRDENGRRMPAWVEKGKIKWELSFDGLQYVLYFSWSFFSILTPSHVSEKKLSTVKDVLYGRKALKMLFPHPQKLQSTQ